jgi:hypothetical protein
MVKVLRHNDRGDRNGAGERPASGFVDPGDAGISRLTEELFMGERWHPFVYPRQCGGASVEVVSAKESEDSLTSGVDFLL